MVALKEVKTYRRGDRVIYGHSQWTARMDAAGDWWEGAVKRVTTKGGVLVAGRRLNSDGPLIDEWIPYNWIARRA